MSEPMTAAERARRAQIVAKPLRALTNSRAMEREITRILRALDKAKGAR